MPWIRVVFRLGKLRIMKSHDGQYFLQWDGRHLTRLPRLRLPKLLGQLHTRRNRHPGSRVDR